MSVSSGEKRTQEALGAAREVYRRQDDRSNLWKPRRRFGGMPGKWEFGLLIYFEGQEDPDRISLFEGSYRECAEEHRSLVGIELEGDLPAAPELICTYVRPVDEAGEQEAGEISRKRISSVVN